MWGSWEKSAAAPAQALAFCLLHHTLPIWCSHKAERKEWLCVPCDSPARATPLGTKEKCAFALQLGEAGGEGRLRKTHGHFIPKHSTNLPLTATVACEQFRCTQFPGRIFLLSAASLSAATETFGDLGCACKESSSNYSVSFAEWDSWKWLIDFPASTEGFSLGPLRTSTKGSEWLGENVFYASKSHWFKLRSNCGPVGV